MVATGEMKTSGPRSRSALALIVLAGKRLAARPWRSLLVVGGIALSAAMLAAVSAGALVARDRAATRAAAEAGPSGWAAVVSWGGVPGEGESWRRLDAT